MKLKLRPHPNVNGIHVRVHDPHQKADIEQQQKTSAQEASSIFKQTEITNQSQVIPDLYDGKAIYRNGIRHQDGTNTFSMSVTTKDSSVDNVDNKYGTDTLSLKDDEGNEGSWKTDNNVPIYKSLVRGETYTTDPKLAQKDASGKPIPLKQEGDKVTDYATYTIQDSKGGPGKTIKLNLNDFPELKQMEKIAQMKPEEKVQLMATIRARIEDMGLVE